jgi:transcriptional regulator with XRE-family HTH domain
VLYKGDVLPKEFKARPKPTNFGNRLKELLSERKMTAFQLHESTKINHSVISRLISGTQAWVSPDMLGRIAAVLCNTPTEQASLIAAKLADEKSVPALPEAEALVLITINGKAPSELGRLKQVPKQLETPLNTIINHARSNPALEQALIHLALALEHKI